MTAVVDNPDRNQIDVEMEALSSLALKPDASCFGGLICRIDEAAESLFDKGAKVSRDSVATIDPDLGQRYILVVVPKCVKECQGE